MRDLHHHAVGRRQQLLEEDARLVRAVRTALRDRRAHVHNDGHPVLVRGAEDARQLLRVGRVLELDVGVAEVELDAVAEEVLALARARGNLLHCTVFPTNEHSELQPFDGVFDSPEEISVARVIRKDEGDIVRSIGAAHARGSMERAGKPMSSLEARLRWLRLSSHRSAGINGAGEALHLDDQSPLVLGRHQIDALLTFRRVRVLLDSPSLRYEILRKLFLDVSLPVPKKPYVAAVP